MSGRALLSLLAVIAFAAGQTNSSAAPDFYALIVNGSPKLLVNYDGNHLFVRGGFAELSGLPARQAAMCGMSRRVRQRGRIDH